MFATRGAYLTALLMLLFSSLYATPLHLDQRNSYWLSEYADYFEDKSGNLTLEDVRHETFTHEHIKDHNFGFTSSTYWFRLTLDPKNSLIDHDWWLRIYYPLLDDIRVYGIDTQSGDLLFEKYSGDLHPYGEREVNHLNFLFSLPLKSRTLTLYVRVQTESSMQVPMVLQSAKAVMEEDQRTILLTGLYYGLFIVIFLYNVIMYAYTRERTYPLYLFFITTFVLWQMTLNGIAKEYIWPDWQWFAEHGAPFLTSLSGTTALLFSQHFLQTARFIPRMNIVLQGLLIYSVVAVILALFLSYRTAMLISIGLAIMVPIVLLISGILVWREKYRPARFYVFGWSSFLLGTVVIALNKYGIFHGYLFFNHIQQLGSALEMIFLSWALADRIKLMQDEYVGKLSTLNLTLQQEVAAGLEKEREKDRMLIKQSRLAAMGEMIEQIAHQWRQPLNTMALIMQDLFFKFKLNTLTEESFEKSNDQINDTLQYMSKTIDDFRNFHQLDKETDIIAVEEVIKMALTLNEASLKYAHIESRIHSDNPHFAVIAKNELVQVFMNLIKNARDVISERGVESGRIDITVDEDESVVRVVVEDNGGGIPDEIMPHIFDPYFTTKEPSKGTGLGLYMSHGIIQESMGGTLQAENGDKGARFVVTLSKRSDET